ncbi:MAG: hypothetical protein AAB354_01140 [candidate division KSB1 bacterium]
MTNLEKLEELVVRSEQERHQREQEAKQREQEAACRKQEFDQQSKERDHRFEIHHREMYEEFYDMTKTLGLFAESMVQPSIVPIFAERGLVLTEVSARISSRRNGGTMEIDVVGAGPEAVVAIEAKSRLLTEYVRDYLKRLPNFFDYFPRFNGLTFYGAVAGLSVDPSAARYAYKNRLFVLVPAAYLVQIWNDERFIPRTFGGPEKKRTRCT